MKSLSLLALVAGAVAQKPARFSNPLNATLESAMASQIQPKTKPLGGNQNSIFPGLEQMASLCWTGPILRSVWRVSFYFYDDLHISFLTYFIIFITRWLWWKHYGWLSIIHALDHIEAAIISDIQHQRVIIVLPALKKTLTCDALTTLIAHQIYTLHKITSKNPIIGPNPSLILRPTSYQEKVTWRSGTTTTSSAGGNPGTSLR